MTATASSGDLELTAEQLDHLVDTLAHAAEQLNEAIELLRAAERVR